MSKAKKIKQAGMFSRLAYIFDTRDKWKIAFLLVAVVIGSFLELLGVTVFMPFINIISDQSNIQRTWYLRMVYDGFGFSSAKQFLIALTIGIIGIYVFKNVYLILEKNFIFRFSYNTQMRLSTRLLDTYMK